MGKKYVFKEYDVIFASLFDKEKERIASHVGAKVLIEHVGSTAIPKLGGKGIIDIAIAVEEAKFDFISEQLQVLGYEFRPQWSTTERLYFRADFPDPIEKSRRYHIHLTHAKSEDWKGFIAFRDYLKVHPEEAEEYAKLKRSAAMEVHEDGEKYRQLKDPLIRKVLDQAREDI